MPDEIPDVQGQQAGAETPAGTQETSPEGTGEQSQHSGVQKRIDELTRERHEANRRAEEYLRQNEQLMALLAQTQTAPRYQEPQVPQMPEMDPDQLKTLDAYFSSKVAPELKRKDQEIAALRAQLGDFGFQTASQNEDPRVVKMAQELMTSWRRNGYSGWKPEDALVYASGAIARQDRSNAQRSRDDRGRFNGMNPPLSGHSSAAPSNSGAGQLPANFERLSPTQQAELLEKRLGDKSF